MRQSHLLEDFKQQQRPIHALHMFFDLDTGFEKVPIENYGHLQVALSVGSKVMERLLV